MIEGKNIFITGGAGFIGSTLVKRLIEKNNITVFDNFNRNALKDTGVQEHRNLNLIKGEILDYKTLQHAMIGSDIIIHCAAIAGIDTVIKNPVNTMRVNMIGSANVLEAASCLDKCDRVICFSTSEIFGQHAFNSTEKDGASIGEIGEARWTYAVSKLAEEHLAISYFSEKKLPVVIVRPFNIYGPGQVGEGAIHTFVKKAVLNEPLEVHGDGTQIRAWCYIDDMVDSVLLIASDSRAIGESYNIGNKRAVTTIYGLANTIVRVLNSSSPINFVWKDYADVELRVPDVRKIKDQLGFEAKIDLEEGIRRTGDYYRTLKCSLQ